MYLKLLSFSLAVLLFSCKETTKTDTSTVATVSDENETPTESAIPVEKKELTPAQLYVNGIEKAHKKTAFLEKKVVKFDLKILFGDQEKLNGTISMLTNTSKLRVDFKGGGSIVYDGTNLYASPKDMDTKGARFGIFTWTYFFALPYKMSDPGVNIALKDAAPLDGKSFTTSKLTFDKNTGDAPDDWYIVYADPQTKLLHAASYIVTYGSDGDTSKAEKDPHAIVYENYKEIDGVPVANNWKFYAWNEEKGLTKQLGSATVSDISFGTTDVSIFEKPEDAVVVE